TENPKLASHSPRTLKISLAHLHHHSNVPIAHGLTNKELSTIESTFNFSFPPDLRSILHEGLPIGQGFPNWRSSSHQQLDILVNLPILGICKEVCRKKFWFCHWGDRPEEDEEAVGLAKRWLKRSPVLVPVYRNCYTPTIPCVHGNPIFYVHGSEVRVCSYDVVGLFHQIDYNKGVVSGMRLGHLLSAPAWAATEARRIEFWTEMAEICRVETGKRWWGGSELGRCLESVRVKLKDGGWKEKDLDDMMMVAESSPPSSVASWSSSSSDDKHGPRETVGEYCQGDYCVADGVWEMWWSRLVV
ncbi:uncharacterized protein LOC143580258, partial [Bidens hawaiensis]|uniref:uncharacterized protein LOC143580258 n=1 Tax=Bidens hawaiensis TaxID=980011 RepID=UPI00404B9231